MPSIKDPGNDGRLRPAEASQPGADLIDATVTGNTRTSIKVDSTISPLVTLPRAGADLVLFWNFNQSAVDSSDDNATFGSRPIFHLENQRLYLDSFFDSFAGRVISQVEAVTAPLQPVGDVLTTAIPILSDLDSSDVTVLDIVGANESIVPILGGLNQLLDLAVLASTLSVGPHVIVGLGAWGNVIGDLRTDTLDEISGEPIHSTANTRPSQVTTFLNEATSIPGLEFPILENSLAATGLLLGREVDLFSWRTPELALSTNFQSYFPVLGPLGITLGGQVGLEMGFGFGFDTQGVIDYRRAASPTDSLFFNGFYAMALNDSGAPLTGITLSAGVTAGIELNLLIASAGVEGDITATVGIYLDDMLGDDRGRVRGDVFETLPMSQWFYAAGSLSAGVRAYLELGWGPFSIEFDFESPRVVLINFDSRDTNQPILAGYDFNHPTDPFALHLNIGERAHLRIHRDTDDRAEELYIRKGSYWDIANHEDYQQYNLDDLFNFQSGDEILAIEGFGAVRLYPVPPKIVGHGNLRGDLISIDRDTDIPVHLTGGDGYDILRGGSADDLLEGGDGPDLLNGRGGNNILLGGPGNDELIAGDGNNILDGGHGEDTASWLEASIPLVMDLRTNTFAGAAAGDTLISIERYKGTLHDDTMHGSEGNDNLNGLSGNDVIHGHGGDDVLVGGFGDDQLFGGEGNDYLDGGPGADLLDGGPGIDIASYLSAKSPVTVSLETGLGTRGDALGDVLVSIEILMGSGLPENQNTPAHLSGDILEGGPGNDIIYGMAGNDFIRGGGGDDILYGNHPDILTFVPPGFDDDTIYGGPGNDILYGQDGDDYLDGEEGHDTLYGGPGNDHLVTFDLAHQDHLDGGTGFDRLSADYSDKSEPLTFTVGEENAHVFSDGDQFHSMETLGHLRTGSGDDVIRLAATIEPSYFAKTIETGPGDDVVIADARFSYINTLRTADHFDGGPGNDWLSFEQSIGPVTANLSNGTTGQFAAPITHTNFENLIGTNFNDTLVGDAGDNIFMPLLIDFIPNAHSYDNIFGGGGIDTLRIDYSSCPLVNEQGLSMNPNTYADINGTMGIALGPNYSVWAGQMMIYYLSIEKFELTGGNASDRFYGDAGFAGNDIFIGLGGNDYMEARRGDDYLDGGEGDDILNAGTGNDTVIGGPGNDTITFMYHLGPDNFYGHDICDAGPGDDIVSNLWLPNFTDTTATNETTIMQFDGGPGYDTLIADLGHMTDPLIWDDATPIDFDLPNGGYIRNFEHLRSIVLGNGDDHITLRGRHPVARRFGLRGGDDTLATSEGHINAYGGPGIDTLILDYRIGDEPGLSGVLREGSLIIRRRLADNVIIDRLQASSFERVLFHGTPKNDTFHAQDVSGSGGVVLFGHEGDDTLHGAGGNDFLFGGPGNDTLNGGHGSDWLDGGPGADIMNGGTGNDTYIVDHPGDQVLEVNGNFNGIDTVRASIDYILPSECENLVLTGNAISGTGNYQANVLTGNARSNILRGEGGNDILDGGGHPGTIDRLHGGPGADRFVLGAAGMRYYDDGNPATPGHDSYAIIEDYTPTATSTSDRLQLAGSAAEYLIGPSPFEETPGTALYHDSNGNGELDPESDELIAILQSAATLTPSNTLTNAIYTQALAPAAVGITAPPTAQIVENPATGPRIAVQFDIDETIPATARIDVQTSTDLGLGDPWFTIASKSGNAAWTGLSAVTTEPAGPGRLRLTIPAPLPMDSNPRMFLRLLLSE